MNIALFPDDSLDDSTSDGSDTDDRGVSVDVDSSKDNCNETTSEDTAKPNHRDKLLELQQRRLQMCAKLSRYKDKSSRKAQRCTNSDQTGDVKSDSKSTVQKDDSNSSDKPSKSQSNTSWAEIKPFLTVNDHLVVACSDKKPKSGLEKKIDDAIAKQDFDAAVTLSDELANRDFGKKIAAAFDAKEYAKKRKCEEDEKAARNKKKLNWVFEHKQRWETKGNM